MAHDTSTSANEEGTSPRLVSASAGLGDQDLSLGRAHDPRPSFVEDDVLSPIQERLAEMHPGEGDDFGVVEALEKGADLSVDDTNSADTDTPIIPPLVASPHKQGLQMPLIEGEEGESAEPSGFGGLNSPAKMAGTEKVATEDRQTDSQLHQMHKFSLYETTTRFFLVGSDVLDGHFRVLKIDRTAPPGQLSIIEDETVYSKAEMNQLLSTIEDGNRAVGGLQYRGTSWGLLGFIRFTEAYYMLLIKRKSQVVTLGGHYIFRIEDTDLIPLTTGSTSAFRNNRNAEEAKFLSILGNLDLNRHFYFSYSYNITRTLQHNIINRRKAFAANTATSGKSDFNDMFVWNHHLLKPAIEALKNPFDWCMPIIHGFIDQAAIDVFGRSVHITIIARRSRFFAGARFLKRGANDLGYVANDVETEQIAADMLVTSFNAPRLRHLKNPNYTSFVQHRGSIPLYWTQDPSGGSPKPAIDLHLIDPFYSTAALHFDDLFARYRAPIYVLNLIKARERTPRESKLLVEYQNAIEYLNQSLPAGKKIRYKAYDMSRAAKTRGQDVIGPLENIADEIVQTTGFFRNDGEPDGDPFEFVQNGIARSNCIDCLDRTNAAQFVVGKRALSLQLQALGVIPFDTSLNYDSDATNLFANMFNTQGDTLASQYGGSHLVNTTDSYRKINNWQSHSRDMLESFKRYYHNSFLDNQRQEAYNLFLGNYVYAQGQPMLWELKSDYYLHHTDPRKKAPRRDYIHWYTPEHLEPVSLPAVPELPPERIQSLRKDWWNEYYRPSVLTSYHRLFAWNMKSTARYLPKPSQRPIGYDLSPFSVRKDGHDMEHMNSRDTLRIDDEEKSSRVRPHHTSTPTAAASPAHAPSKRVNSLQKWLYPDVEDDHDNQSSARSKHGDATNSAQSHQRKKSLRTSTLDNGEEARIIAGMKEFKPSNKQLKNQWTLAQFHANSLNPSVTDDEVAEYEHYLQLPQSLGATDSAGLTDAYSSAQNSSISTDELKVYEDYVASGTQGPPASVYPSGDDLRGEIRLKEAYATYLRSPQELALNVTADDVASKRYQVYGKWMRGKSLFKQSKVDPEVKMATGAGVGDAKGVAG